jgi:two-component system, OmpR family, sensor histidine kinase KdpD
MAAERAGRREPGRQKLDRQNADRGKLQLFLGVAPGAGKTYAMLAEGRQRAALGQDVVIGLADPHGRPDTKAQASGLEVVPLRRVPYRGTAFDDLDVPAVLARNPEVVLVDELAHSVLPGGRHDKRWLDVAELLEAGIDVVSCLNVQHLESLADRASKLTGVAVGETVPDAFAATADRVDLLDVDPETLRDRIARLYPSAIAMRALAGYFRLENLGALAGLGRRWIREHGFGPAVSPSSGDVPLGSAVS